MAVNKIAFQRDLSSLAILVVDDSDNMRKLLRAILSTLDVTPTVEVATATDALRALQEFPINLVITDLEMDPVSGIELVRMIRSNGDSAKQMVPIIMLTGHTDRHLVEEARDVGIDEFVAKPVSHETLYDRIIEILDNLRPFVISKSYYGPDRRRHAREYSGEERRREPPKLVSRDI